jgi:hypothetical protein
MRTLTDVCVNVFRLIGHGERAIEEILKRGMARLAFGKSLLDLGGIYIYIYIYMYIYIYVHMCTFVYRYL